MLNHWTRTLFDALSRIDLAPWKTYPLLGFRGFGEEEVVEKSRRARYTHELSLIALLEPLRDRGIGAIV